MESLAHANLSVETRVASGLRQNYIEIVNHLHQGWPVLVPYDADGNHEPSTKQGHKAHWALVIGYCILTQFDGSTGTEQLLRHLMPKQEMPLEVQDILRSGQFSKLIIYTKQGKSKYIKSWEFEKLCQSNENLFEVGPKLLDEDYVLPNGKDLKHCLCNKFLFIKAIV